MWAPAHRAGTASAALQSRGTPRLPARKNPKLIAPTRRSCQRVNAFVAELALINVDYVSPSFWLGVGVATSGLLLYSLKMQKASGTKDLDTVTASLLMLAGGIVTIQGWRLDPILMLSEGVLASVGLYYIAQTVNLRKQLMDEREAALPDPRKAGRFAEPRAEENPFRPAIMDDAPYSMQARGRPWGPSERGRRVFDAPRDTEASWELRVGGDANDQVAPPQRWSTSVSSSRLPPTPRSAGFDLADIQLQRLEERRRKTQGRFVSQPAESAAFSDAVEEWQAGGLGAPPRPSGFGGGDRDAATPPRLQGDAGWQVVGRGAQEGASEAGGWATEAGTGWSGESAPLPSAEVPPEMWGTSAAAQRSQGGEEGRVPPRGRLDVGADTGVPGARRRGNAWAAGDSDPRGWGREPS